MNDKTANKIPKLFISDKAKFDKNQRMAIVAKTGIVMPKGSLKLGVFLALFLNLNLIVAKTTPK